MKEDSLKKELLIKKVIKYFQNVVLPHCFALEYFFLSDLSNG